MTAELTTTDLNDLNTRIAVRVGNTMRLEISSAPIILMPRTIVIDVRKAMSILYAPA